MKKCRQWLKDKEGQRRMNERQQITMSNGWKIMNNNIE